MQNFEKLCTCIYLSQEQTLRNEHNSCMLSFAFFKTNLVTHFWTIFIQRLKCNTFAQWDAGDSTWLGARWGRRTINV